VADVIGVQSPGNLAYFNSALNQSWQRIEVLQNWLADAPVSGCSINVAETMLSGRKVFVYAGNMGVAQGMDILLDLAEQLLPRKDIGFLFVGRGSDANRLYKDANARKLDNVLFCDEIDPYEIPGLYAQCSVGLVALDPRHKSHNVPGKFLTYMQSGLPVLANINAGNDLARIIRQEKVGRVSEVNSVDSLMLLALDLIDSLDTDTNLERRCRGLYSTMFSPDAAVVQITASFRDIVFVA
jgi:glycosyltransferase involved in cell wall biosynthesis